MELRKLLTDDDAVSPVIGVILMVAITVILAAVIASFVLGIGDQQEVQPTAQFDFDYDSSADLQGEGQVTITHTSGDSVTNDRVVIRGQNLDLTNTTGSSERGWGDVGGGTSWADVNNGTLSGSNDGAPAIVSGDSAAVDTSGDDWEIRVVWESSGGGSTATLAQESGPGA